MVIPDLPFGAHRSPVLDRSQLSPDKVAAALVDFLDSLSIPQVVLLGNDSGGALCQIAVAAAPERFTSLILTSCDAFDNFPPSGFKLFAKLCHLPGLTRSFVKLFSLTPFFAKPGRFNNLVRHPVSIELVKDWTEPSLTDTNIRRDLISWVRSMKPEYTLAAARGLSQYEGPTVIAWSREDKIFPPAHAQKLVEIIPNSTLVWIDNALAFSPLDQPAAVAQAVRSLINQHN